MARSILVVDMARRLYSMGPLFSAATKSVRLQPVESLHLNNRTINVLRCHHIKSIGQLLDSLDKNPRILLARGKRTSDDLRDALSSLSLSLDRGRGIDWVTYARRRQLTILPDNQRTEWTPRAFLQELVKVAKISVQIRFGSSGLSVLQDHFLTSSCRRTSLAQIARNLGVTRERARKIATSIVEMFVGILHEDNYCGCQFRILPNFLNPLRTISAALESNANGILAYSDWESLLVETWRIQPLEVASVERLLLAVLGFQRVDFSERTLRPIIVPKSRRDGEQLYAALRHIKHLLTVQYPHGLRSRELLNALANKFGPFAVSLTELPALVRSIAALEEKKAHGRYRARGGSLKNPANQYERLLREAGKPLHFKEIIDRTRRATCSGLIQSRSVTNVLTEDPRFVAMAQSGFWALTEWRNIETRTITNIAADLIEKAGGPLDQDCLYTLIKARRPVARDSIRALLGRDARFRRTGVQMWSLVERRI
jgi:hypothetical protein